MQHKLSVLSQNDPRQLNKDQIEDLILNVNLNAVCLYFEALYVPPTIDCATGNSISNLICAPVVSTVVQHNSMYNCFFNIFLAILSELHDLIKCRH